MPKYRLKKCRSHLAASSANFVNGSLSGVAHTRIGTPSDLPALHAKSPNSHVSKYVDIFGVVANVTVCFPGAGAATSDRTTVFEMPLSPLSSTSDRSNVAFNAGGLADGVYHAKLCVNTDAMLYRTLAVPVIFTVGAGDRIFGDGFDGAP